MSLRVESKAFTNGSRIPGKYTCVGEDVSIPITIGNTPPNTKSLLLIMYDPDAPYHVFYHWILYNIPASTIEIPEGLEKTGETEYGLQGVNDFGKVGYGGPCPSPGHGVHRYVVLVLALDKELDLDTKASLDQVISQASGHVIAYGYIIGTYSR